MLRDFEASDYRLASPGCLPWILHGSGSVCSSWTENLAVQGGTAKGWAVTASRHSRSKKTEAGEVLLRTARVPGSFQNLFATPTLSNCELYLLRSPRSGFETCSLQQRGWEMLQCRSPVPAPCLPGLVRVQSCTPRKEMMCHVSQQAAALQDRYPSALCSPWSHVVGINPHRTSCWQRDTATQPAWRRHFPADG